MRYELKEGEFAKATEFGYIVASRDKPPFLVRHDGSIEELEWKVEAPDTSVTISGWYMATATFPQHYLTAGQEDAETWATQAQPDSETP